MVCVLMRGSIDTLIWCSQGTRRRRCEKDEEAAGKGSSSKATEVKDTLRKKESRSSSIEISFGGKKYSRLVIECRFICVDHTFMFWDLCYDQMWIAMTLDYMVVSLTHLNCLKHAVLFLSF